MRRHRLHEFLIAYAKPPRHVKSSGRNELGRLTRKTLPGTNNYATYEYDAAGDVTRADTYAGAVRQTRVDRVYDLAHRVTSATQQVGTLGSQTVQYAYAPGGLLTGVTAGGLAVTYQYDTSVARLTGVALGALGTVDYAYDAAGRLTRKSYPSAAKTDLAYDRRSRVTSIAHTTSGAATISSHTLGYDGTENLTCWIRVGLGA